MEEQEIKLTQLSHGAGCGCKIAPDVLQKILATSDVFPSPPQLLVGNETSDDAAVYQIDDERCIISTTDFFLPIVDDPYDFGRIAATNAISDVYAMGGKPLMAVAILGWPIDKLPPAMAQRVLEGARFMCRMAGITLAGGHSINSTEPIFGLAVTGEVNIANLKKNNTAQEGDLLYITKPLGVGIISTAAKRGLAKQADIDEATSYMCTLNKLGEQLGTMPGITALTDITGFGLLGHLIEMADGSELSATITFDHVPVIPCVKDYLASFIYPDMTMKSYAANAAKVSTLNANQLLTLCDPQTSGGLLVAVRPEHQAAFEQVARDFGLQGIADRPIGTMTSKAEKTVTVN